MSQAKQSPGRGKIRLLRDDPIQEIDGILDVDDASAGEASPNHHFGLKKILVGRYVLEPIVDQIFAGLQSERHAQGRGDGPRDVFLYGEDVGEVAVVIVRPNLQAVLRLNELRRDAHAVSRLAHRAFDEVGRAERLPYGARFLVLAFELERGRAGDNTQIRHFRERTGDFVGHAVGEEIPACITRHVCKGHDRNGNRIADIERGPARGGDMPTLGCSKPAGPYW